MKKVLVVLAGVVGLGLASIGSLYWGGFLAKHVEHDIHKQSQTYVKD